VAAFFDFLCSIWKEKLLASLLKGDAAQAADMVRSRIAARDKGDFVSGGKSFYERSLDICEAMRAHS
jgi:hypothetical protein